MSRRVFAPITVVLAVALAVWIVSGVSVGDIGKFVGYEIAFVLLPGVALLWVLRGRLDGALVTVALGWPLGQTLEVLAFCATAATGTRGLFVIYPFVVIVLCSLVFWRRRNPSVRAVGRERLSNGMMWTAAAFLSIGLIYLAIAFVPQGPLPSTAPSVSYYVDFPFYIGLIAEVKNHWPPTSPGLVGFPLHYELFVFDHMAAISQVTGVDIPTIALKLDVVPTILVLGCQLLAVGRFIGRSAWIGVIAIGVVFLLGPLDLTTDPGATPFVDQLHFDLWANWTFPFGLMFLLALIYLMAEQLQATSWRIGDELRALSLIALIMIGASGAKATILPVVIAGTGLYVVVHLVIRRAIHVRALILLLLGVVAFGATFAVVYAGGVPGTAIEPFAFMSRTVPGIVAANISNRALRDVAKVVGYLIALAGILLPLTGMSYLLRRRYRPEIPRFALCLCFLVAGIILSNAVHQVGTSELYFLDTGYIAGAFVAAAGLRAAWLDIGVNLPITIRRAVLAFVVWIAIVAALVCVTSPTAAHPAGLLLRYGAIAVLGILFVLLLAFVFRTPHPSLPGTVALGLIPILAISALAFPIQLAPTAKRALSGEPLTITRADPQTVRGLTPGIVQALNWLRDDTPISTVIAVSNHWIDSAGTDGRYYYYSAFSERRVFVEAYNPLDYGLDYPPLTPAFASFLYRTRLNNAVFDDADAAALRILTQQYGVRFLLIDRLHHNADPELLTLGKVVFSDSDATILAVS